MKLKPCPFCGLPAKMHTAYYTAEFAYSDDQIPIDEENGRMACRESAPLDSRERESAGEWEICAVFLPGEYCLRFEKRQKR